MDETTGACVANLAPVRALLVNDQLAARPLSENLSRGSAKTFVKSFAAHQLCSDRVDAQMRRHESAGMFAEPYGFANALGPFIQNTTIARHMVMAAKAWPVSANAMVESMPEPPIMNQKSTAFDVTFWSDQ